MYFMLSSPPTEKNFARVHCMYIYIVCTVYVHCMHSVCTCMYKHAVMWAVFKKKGV